MFISLSLASAELAAQAPQESQAVQEGQKAQETPETQGSQETLAAQEKVLLIVGETAEETTVSGVELELFRQNADGSVGERVGSYVSESEENGIGHIHLSLEQGSYIYRVLPGQYVLPEKATWKDFAVEAGENTILVWVEPRIGKPTDGEKTRPASIKPEEKPSGEKGEISGKAKGEFNLNQLIFGAYGGIWVTLIVLLVVILAVVGLDYRMRHRR